MNIAISQAANQETTKRKEKMQALHDDLEQMRGSTMGGALEKLTEVFFDVRNRSSPDQ